VLSIHGCTQGLDNQAPRSLMAILEFIEVHNE